MIEKKSKGACVHELTGFINGLQFLAKRLAKSSSLPANEGDLVPYGDAVQRYADIIYRDYYHLADDDNEHEHNPIALQLFNRLEKVARRLIEQPSCELIASLTELVSELELAVVDLQRLVSYFVPQTAPRITMKSDTIKNPLA